MTFLTPAQKREHFENHQMTNRSPAAYERHDPPTMGDLKGGCRRLLDEVAAALRLEQARLSCLRRAHEFRHSFPATAQTLAQAARTHRRMWWYALAAAVREVGTMFAAVNGYDPLDHDEAGPDLDEDNRRLLEWLVDVGRVTKARGRP